MNSELVLRRSTDRPDMPRAARMGLLLLSRIRHGQIRIQFPDGSSQQFGCGQPCATLRLNNWRVFDASMRDGDIGFAESYIAGDWTSDSLIDLLRVVVANRDRLEQAVYGHWTGRLLNRFRHLLNRNTRTGSRKNIHAHYDLGNAFYRLWLDETMSYSSALFSHPGVTLPQAQQAKYERILDELALTRGESILEIGCGWGGFAERAALRGHPLTGLTLSREQLEFARHRLAGQASATTPELALRDYRDESGRYDAIVSIEMFEAVGQAYWSTYFSKIARCLKRGGRAVIQTITIDEALFERYRRSSDFIQQYVFPGGMLPSPSAFERAAVGAGLVVQKRFAFGPDYGRTLSHWRDRFLAEADAISAQGFDARFMRIWHFYLAYCQAAFEQGNTDVMQFTLTHADK